MSAGDSRRVEGRTRLKARRAIEPGAATSRKQRQIAADRLFPARHLDQQPADQRNGARDEYQGLHLAAEPEHCLFTTGERFRLLTNVAMGRVATTAAWGARSGGATTPGRTGEMATFWPYDVGALRLGCAIFRAANEAQRLNLLSRSGLRRRVAHCAIFGADTAIWEMIYMSLPSVCESLLLIYIYLSAMRNK